MWFFLSVPGVFWGAADSEVLSIPDGASAKYSKKSYVVAGGVRVEAARVARQESGGESDHDSPNALAVTLYVGESDDLDVSPCPGYASHVPDKSEAQNNALA